LGIARRLRATRPFWERRCPGTRRLSPFYCCH
jgi:hypothetical protein